MSCLYPLLKDINLYLLFKMTQLKNLLYKMAQSS